MEVTTANGVKVYNLSAGKSLPEWISDRKKRTLLKNDSGLRQRIELLQDFSMPVAATGVAVSSDGQYIFGTGVYKPRVRCYDVHHLSMKFERCVDSEIIDFSLLSEDYTKFALLLANRQIEFHAQFGFYYRTRVPRFGRSLAYHSCSCDLYITAEGSEIYRLNLEQGQFLPPFLTKASGCNVCQFNPHHQLFTVGTEEGTVECWDPRYHCRVGELSLATAGIQYWERDVLPAVTALHYRDSINLAIGTSSGQVLLYDLRSAHPYLIKDHFYSSPIHSLSFQTSENLVLSADSKILKIWNETDGSTYTSIEPEHDINQLCHLPDTGVMLVAMEDPKMLAYYIPSVGPTPQWCSFLDNLTEELEEDEEQTVYDDYKFVTSKDLEELGLSHLVGTNLLRAYMHGYFMDIKLYHKARAVAQPFGYEEFRKEKIRKKMEEARASRIRKEEDSVKGKKRAQDASHLRDERFAAMYTDKDFEVDEESEEFQRLHPVISHREKRKKLKEEREQADEMPADGDYSSGDESDPETWKEVRREMKERRETVRSVGKTHTVLPNSKLSTSALGKRLKEMGDKEEAILPGSSLGSKEETFTIAKNDPKSEERKKKLREHQQERRKVRRSAKSILPNKNRPVYWRGKRVK